MNRNVHRERKTMTSAILARLILDYETYAIEYKNSLWVLLGFTWYRNYIAHLFPQVIGFLRKSLTSLLESKR